MFAAAAALCVALVGCAGVPVVNDTPGAAPPKIVGASGPLTAAQSKALFAKIGPAAQDALQRHLAVEQAVAETPLVAGNRTRILRDGGETFPAMFDAIRGARHHINLEYFIFQDVESEGERLSDLLLAKCAEGVAVNIIYDSFGSSATPREFFDRLKQAGAQVVQFNPLNPLDGAPDGYRPNDRDHRKILIVDGSTAIIGGVNLSTAYQSVPGKSGAAADQANVPWRDTDLEIVGPAVAQLQRLFLIHWRQQKGPTLRAADFFPEIPPAGKEVVRIIGSAPEDLAFRYYVTVLSAIRAAETRIWLSAGYFVPTHQAEEDLVDAARRGIDVRLLLPDESDSQLALAVQHSRYEDLLEAGVKIYEVRHEVLHSKTIAIDGVWSVIGSSNFDHRSVLFNDEVDAVVVGRDTAAALERMFRSDVAQARAIELSTWRDRPLADKVTDYLARIWESLL
ncbi:MAG TPA: phospholipase D-like domain-containing protein [Stellaceae bacterium]|nr:phospholipase D-like domain-containing protein [Stellaceae bacterium]